MLYDFSHIANSNPQLHEGGGLYAIAGSADTMEKADFTFSALKEDIHLLR
ncbi:MAG: hypothetical protein WBO16_00400 [Gammaproteobacteria bacterium]|jgi:hypothetical protein